MMGEIMTTKNQEQAGKGTPPSKQAKRDREAAEHWKKSSTEKTEAVKAERRMKEEARKQRDRLKEEFRIKIKGQANRIEEIEQLYEKEKRKLLEEEQRREKIGSYKLLLDLRDSSNIFIKGSQEQLQRQFSTLKNRFYKEKNRLGDLLHATQIHCHSYRASLIRLIIGLMIGCAIGPRTVKNVLKIFSEYIDIPTPARSTISHLLNMISI